MQQVHNIIDKLSPEHQAQSTAPTPRAPDGKRKLVVFTATGDQGGSVVEYALKDGKWDVWGITRNVGSDNAKTLADKGVHIVQGDLGNPSSYAHALHGADACFVNADFWATYFSSGLDDAKASATESSHSRDAIDECVKAKVGHVVYSTLDDLPDDKTCPHFKSKAEIAKYLRSLPIASTLLYTSTYISNCFKFQQISKNPDGTFTYTCPCPDQVVLPAFAVEQTGAWVMAAFNKPAEWIGKDMEAVSDLGTVADMAKTLSEVSGKTVVPRHMTDEEFFADSLKQQITPELWLQYKMFYYSDMPRNIAKSKAVVQDQWDVRAWAVQSADLHKLLEF